MKKYFISILLLFSIISPVVAQSYILDTPRPQGWVSDFAQIIPSQTKEQINIIAAEIEKRTSAEIAVVTVKNLNGLTIEDYTVKLFEKWKIGKKDKNNGVLFLISLEDRKARIEVGYGLEGALPDGLCGEILDKNVIPSFKQGDYGQGILEGVYRIALVTAKEYNIDLSNGLIPENTIVPDYSQNGYPPLKLGLANVIFIVIIFIIALYLMIFHPGLFFWLLLNVLLSGGRGGGGGGFGSGGGFGGFGGGSSGGGGSSRGW
ncbi:MAG: hypothetical protein A3J83_07070 [Elusimicrobia bacterium RIFOXYA2_FULL_40_6]|nr:MAG: hypothetical protein A3J83_07070 [Elusimicrobia bacterium RIFOXYA2_FULL_40_6]